MVYSVAAVLYLRSVLPVTLFLIFCTSVLLHQHFPPSSCAVHSVAVFFYSHLISRFPGTLLRHRLTDSEMVLVAPYYYWYHICSHITPALNFYYAVFII
jgi:hypothetical protein